MAPLVTGGSCLSRFFKEANQPYVLKIKITQASSTTEWYLNGSGGLPGPSVAAESADNVVSQHNWMPGHNPWPLWFVKRVLDTEQANCKFEEVLVRMVSTFAPAAPLEAFADNVDITIPMLVNTKAVAAGDELRVLWAPRHKQKAEQGGTYHVGITGAHEDRQAAAPQVIPTSSVEEMDLPATGSLGPGQFCAALDPRRSKSQVKKCRRCVPLLHCDMTKSELTCM